MPPGNDASGPLTVLDRARSELSPVSVGAVIPIGLLIVPIGLLLVIVACITIVGGTITVIVIVSACRGCSYSSGANGHAHSATHVGSAINSTVGNASVMHSYTSVMHSHTSASTSKSIARCSRYTCRT
jgi:hypothetical protein